MDQTLRPFYEADLAAGRIDARGAFDLICCLYIQGNMILGAGSAISVMVGGRDRTGRDATNDLTYLCLAARSATRLVYPTVGLAWHDGTPQELTDFACRMIVTGIGDPAFFNDELISRGLRDHGVSIEDSYDYMNSTCVEIKVVGASHVWVTAPYFNCPKAMLEVMARIASAADGQPATFSEFKDLVKLRLAETVTAEAQKQDAVWHQRALTGGFPLASSLVRDCLDQGKDFDRGGARYNWVENSFVGLANLVDGLVAVDRLVYGTRELIVKCDFQGHEGLRRRILNQFPCYGTDDEEADRIAVEMAEFLEDTTESNVVGLHPYVPGFFCFVLHEHLGSETGATPDGRRSGFPLADGAGASQGRERKGPTASLLSTTKWNHRRALGGIVQNIRFAKNTFRSPQDIAALRHLAETYLGRGGFELQINVVGSETLRDAQAHPDLYKDLLVRVAGYSDYFVHLNRNMQEEVIQRTEHLLR
jgi:pyruvate-formate lyase